MVAQADERPGDSVKDNGTPSFTLNGDQLADDFYNIGGTSGGGTCSAKAYCFDSEGTKIGEVSCSGNVSCTVYPGYVVCDTVRSNCG